MHRPGGAVYRKCTNDLYAIHALVWDLFADTPGRKRDFLYRQETGQDLPAFLCISEREPHDRQGIWVIETKPYAPVVRSGQVSSFLPTIPVMVRSTLPSKEVDPSG